VIAHLGVEASDYCSQGEVSIDRCLQAGRDLVSGENTAMNLYIGSWEHVPPGCATRSENGRILFNNRPDGNNDGHYAPICAGEEIVPVLAHLDSEASDHCSSSSVSIESCLQAVRDLIPQGAEQEVSILDSGDFPDKPPGCSMGIDSYNAYFNTNAGGHNSGDFVLVCEDESSLRTEVEALEAAVGEMGDVLDGLVESTDATDARVGDLTQRVENLEPCPGSSPIGGLWGCNTGYPETTPICDGSSAIGAVRCCLLYGDECRSEIAGACHSGKTFQEAVDVCGSNGMRLCTETEYREQCCGTGCSFDAVQVWLTL
jgi:hypothetical protein